MRTTPEFEEECRASRPFLCEHRSSSLLCDGVVVGRHDWEASEWQNLDFARRGVDGAKKGRAVLVFIDGAVLSVSQVFETITELGNEGGNEGVQGSDPLVLTSASLLSFISLMPEGAPTLY